MSMSTLKSKFSQQVWPLLSGWISKWRFDMLLRFRIIEEYALNQNSFDTSECLNYYAAVGYHGISSAFGSATTDPSNGPVQSAGCTVPSNSTCWWEAPRMHCFVLKEMHCMHEPNKYILWQGFVVSCPRSLPSDIEERLAPVLSDPQDNCSLVTFEFNLGFVVTRSAQGTRLSPATET